MAYDELLAARFRDTLDGVANISEKRMMGGVCFLVNGNMIGGAHREKTGDGRFLFRVGKENDAKARARPGAMPMVQGGRRMRGFILVDADACDGAVLADWVALARSYAESLPAK